MAINQVMMPQKKASGGGGILGKLLGTGLGGLGGFIVGGPAGAVTGAGLGSQVGGTIGEVASPTTQASATQGVNRLQSMVPQSFDVQLAMLENAKQQVKSAPDISPEQAMEFQTFFSDAQNKLKQRLT